MAFIEANSSSPNTAIYMAVKSMTGTVRVPSMSKTTPLSLALPPLLKCAMGVSQGCRKLKKDVDGSNDKSFDRIIFGGICVST